MRLITHSGTFHADDVTAAAILTALHPGAEVVRTRDFATIEAARGKDIVFDVGSAYSHPDRRYDHHMTDAPRRPDGTPYSSVGLVWLHYGMSYLALSLETREPDFLSRVWKAVDGGLVREIDLLDNGIGSISASSLPAIVDDFNPAWDGEGDIDSAFADAVATARPILARRVSAIAARERAATVVREAATRSDDPRIIVLPSSMPWESALFEGGFDQALYVVYPKSEDAWYCAAVPPEPGSFAQRRPLPAAWAGLRDQELADVSGIPDATFCHPGRFVCGARSREGIVSMARAACAVHPDVDALPGQIKP